MGDTIRKENVRKELTISKGRGIETKNSLKGLQSNTDRYKSLEDQLDRLVELKNKGTIDKPYLQYKEGISPAAENLAKQKGVRPIKTGESLP